MNIKSIVAIVLSLTFALSACNSTAPASVADPRTQIATDSNQLETQPMAARAAVGEGDSPVAQADSSVNIAFNSAENLVALLIGDDKHPLMRAAQHGFLRTAENLGYPALLLSAETDAQAAKRVDEAIEKGVDGLIIWADCIDMIQAADKARQAGIKVIVPYYDAKDNCDANLAADPYDYMVEVARIMCEEAKTRGNDGGKILVIGAPGEEMLGDAFLKAVSMNYPQFQVVTSMEVATLDSTEEAPSKIEQFMRENLNLAGVLALEGGSAKVGIDTVNAVNKGSTPAQTEAPKKKEETAPTPTPVAIKKLNPVIVALDYTDENIKLVNDGQIYAFIARPYFDSTAQSMAIMDRMLRGMPVQKQVRLNAPVIRKKGLDKYVSVVNEVNAWFS